VPRKRRYLAAPPALEGGRRLKPLDFQPAGRNVAIAPCLVFVADWPKRAGWTVLVVVDSAAKSEALRWTFGVRDEQLTHPLHAAPPASVSAPVAEGS